MIHPSYVELMNKVNEDCTEEEPIVNSRYSIVIAAAKRARQLIDHAEAFHETDKDEKPLSIAVEELYKGEIHIERESDEKMEEVAVEAAEVEDMIEDQVAE